MIFDKNKENKIKEHAKGKSFTAHLLLFSLIIFAAFHTIFASFDFVLFQYFYDILLKYTPISEVVVLSVNSPSLLMQFFFFQYISIQSNTYS